MLRLALQEALQGDLGLETHLGFHADIHQDTTILVPLTDAVQIAGATFIINDEGRNLVTEAFFEHQQAPNAAIAILEGTDALEADMEIENLMEADIFPSLVFFEEQIDGCRDLGRGCSLAKLGCSGRLAISGDNGSVALMAAALAEEGGLQLLDESLSQRLHGVGENHIHTEEVIPCFDNVVDLDGFFVGEDPVGLVQNLDLIPCESVAGHASVAVDHIDLQVFIEAAVRSAVALLDKGFEKFGKLRSFLFLSDGLGCIFRYVPSFKLLIGIGDAFLHAIDAYHSF